jgi:hypothetical protein
MPDGIWGMTVYDCMLMVVRPIEFCIYAVSKSTIYIQGKCVGNLEGLPEMGETFAAAGE